ncbi:MAG TPA: DUF308 domain-containing protein [Gemmatimonadaceae bacterium]|jgi:uncharacterized membrane protein HdeD (DUF308 family)
MSELIRTAYRRTWWALVLRGLLGIAIGVLIFWRPLDSIATLALLIAWWALFGGVVQLVHAFALRSVFPKWWVLLLSGLIGIVFGIAALYNYPGLSLAFAVIWVAWWLIVSGALAVYAAVVERSIGLSWGWTLAFGLVALAAGVFAIMSPGVTLASIMGLIAGFAIVSGFVHLMGAYSLSSAKAEVIGAQGVGRT